MYSALFARAPCDSSSGAIEFAEFVQLMAKLKGYTQQDAELTAAETAQLNAGRGVDLGPGSGTKSLTLFVDLKQVRWPAESTTSSITTAVASATIGTVEDIMHNVTRRPRRSAQPTAFSPHDLNVAQPEA